MVHSTAKQIAAYNVQLATGQVAEVCTSTRSPEGLVGGGRHNMRMLKGVSHHLSSHKAGCVGHVCHEVRAHIVCSLPHAGVVVVTRIC